MSLISAREAAWGLAKSHPHNLPLELDVAGRNRICAEPLGDLSSRVADLSDDETAMGLGLRCQLLECLEPFTFERRSGRDDHVSRRLQVVIVNLGVGDGGQLDFVKTQSGLCRHENLDRHRLTMMLPVSINPSPPSPQRL